jgi:threonine/homoserine/homoserine lactone efflux protein
MTLDLWLAFVVAAVILVAIPGPTVMLVVGYALSQGRSSGRYTVPGVALGDVTAMSLSFIGLGALLAASAELFRAVQWAGAAYLVYLGVQLWRAPPVVAAAPVPRGASSRWRMLGHAWAVTSLNPKGIVFFVAFVPQFLSPNLPVAPQLLLLGATFSVIATLNSIAYALLAGSVRAAVSEPRVVRAIHRIGGSILIAAGIVTAGLKHVA